MPKKYLSYSEINLWLRDKESYYRRYIKGETDVSTRPQTIGKIIHSAVEDPKYPWWFELKSLDFNYGELIRVKKIMHKLWQNRGAVREVFMTAEFDGIKLLSIFDGLDKKPAILYEYKTHSKDNSWTQWFVDSNQQLSFYALVFQLNYHQYFNDIQLFSCNIKKGTVKTFHTARSAKDISEVKDMIRQGVKELKAEGLWDKRLSRDERAKLHNLKLKI